MADIGGLANFAAIAAAINLAYINLDNYRYLKKMKEYLFSKLENIETSRVLNIFKLIEKFEHPTSEETETGVKIQNYYAFLQLFGGVSEYKIRVPKTGEMKKAPNSKTLEKAQESEKQNYKDELTKIVISLTPEQGSDSNYPVKPTKVFSFFKTFFYQSVNTLRTKDQLFSIIAMFASLSVLAVISFDTAVSSTLSQNYPYVLPILILALILIVLVYVIIWLRIQHKIRVFLHPNAKISKSPQYFAIISAPLFILLPSLAYTYPTDFGIINASQGYLETSLPVLFFLILSISILLPFRLLLNGYRLIPLIERQIDASIEFLIDQSKEYIDPEQEEEKNQDLDDPLKKVVTATDEEFKPDISSPIMSNDGSSKSTGDSKNKKEGK